MNNVVLNERINIQNKTKEIEVLLIKEQSNQTEISKVKSNLDNLVKKENLNEQIINELRSQIDFINNKNKLKNCIVINSDNSINGIDIQIIFYPKEFDYDSLYRGYCVFNFIIDGYNFPFQIYDFTMPTYSAKGIVLSEDSLETLNCPFQEITVELAKLPIFLKIGILMEKMS